MIQIIHPEKYTWGRTLNNKVNISESMVNTKKEFILVDVKTETESKGERRYIFNE